MSKLHLVLLIHGHQPVGNFGDVFERAYQHSYLPFVECLERHPGVRVGLHYSGSLLEWIEPKHPEYFERLRGLVARGQAELVGGGFYEPILIVIPPEDQLEQLRRMSAYLERRFGQRPSGAWLAERVWEPQLPSVLAPAKVVYTLVDDIHFLAAGFELDQLHGYYVAEDRGATVKVIPGLKALRYLIPFHSVEETIGFLRGAAQKHPGGLAAMGDDCEKFGMWPSTYEHCYRDGWLERFFAALEANADWLVTVLPGEYLAANTPLGRADLPAASYTEMMEWALPTTARQRFHALQQEFASRPDVERFLRGGFWRCFLTKYAEANLLHKKMLHVSGKLRRLAARRRPALERKVSEATTHLLRGQCNDAYWHGIFGGLYAPQLRTAVWRELIRAEKLADAAAHSRASAPRAERLDFDADGAEEIYVTSRQFAALLKPSDGATLAALDFRKNDVALINSIKRRPEAYHARLGEASSGASGGVASIHEQTRVKEEGLERCLRYDRWLRHAFRLLLFAPGKTCADYEALCLEENAAFAAGAYRVVAASGGEVELTCEAPLDAPTEAGRKAHLRVAKTFSFANSPQGFSVSCALTLACRGSEPRKLTVGLEIILNLLAPNEPDRYFETADGARHRLSWGAAVPASQLRAVDEWQNVTAEVEAPGASQFWVVPIETVSESEEGFERVYQGSQILAVWPVELLPEVAWSAQAMLRVAPAR